MAKQSSFDSTPLKGGKKNLAAAGYEVESPLFELKDGKMLVLFKATAGIKSPLVCVDRLYRILPKEKWPYDGVYNDKKNIVLETNPNPCLYVYRGKQIAKVDAFGEILEDFVPETHLPNYRRKKDKK